jgi:hypothetical protein
MINLANAGKRDRDLFFEGYRKQFGRLSQGQVDGINFLLTKLEGSTKIRGANDNITLAMYAYVLMTVKWETANTFQPVTEYGSQAYLKSKRYYPYIGRGYVQLTWSSNYINFGKVIGKDLYNNPDLANDPEIAWLVLEEGMTDLTPQDPEFTGKSLEDYFNEDRLDFYNARKIINPKDWDSYNPITKGALKFFEILKNS